MRASTGMSRSAQRMRFLPCGASLGSLTSERCLVAVVIYHSILGSGRAARSGDRAATVSHAAIASRRYRIRFTEIPTEG